MFRLLLQILLELLEAHLIRILKLPILLSLLLDGVVGQVDEFVVDVVQGEFLAGGADVALVVPVAFGEGVVGGD